MSSVNSSIEYSKIKLGTAIANKIKLGKIVQATSRAVQ
jgi:hypothetical protein